MKKIKFEWDEAKAKSNLIKYGVSFDEAKSVFDDDFARVIYDETHSKNEERFVILGMSKKLRILVVVHCLRQDGLTVRLISARKATQNEQNQYKEFL